MIFAILNSVIDPNDGTFQKTMLRIQGVSEAKLRTVTRERDAGHVSQIGSDGAGGSQLVNVIKGVQDFCQQYQVEAQRLPQVNEDAADTPATVTARLWTACPRGTKATRSQLLVKTTDGSSLGRGGQVQSSLAVGAYWRTQSPIERIPLNMFRGKESPEEIRKHCRDIHAQLQAMHRQVFWTPSIDGKTMYATEFYVISVDDCAYERMLVGGIKFGIGTKHSCPK
jgi:hypothetical protein